MGGEPLTAFFRLGVDIFINCHQLLSPFLEKKYLEDEEVIPIIEKFKEVYKTQKIGINISSDNIKEIKKVNPNVYLFSFSREEALKLLDNLQKELKELEIRQKPEKSKKIRINLYTTKLKLKGLSFEIKNIQDFRNITNIPNDMINALEVFSLQLNAKYDLNSIKGFAEMISPFGKACAKEKNLNFNFRYNDNKIFIDYINNDNKFLKEILDLPINIFELFDFKVLFNSEIDVLDFFNLEKDELFSKATLFNFSADVKADTINYISNLFIKLIEEKEIKNIRLKKYLENILLKLTFIKPFLSFSLNLEISNKDLIPLKNSLCDYLSGLKMVIEFFMNLVVPIIQNIGKKYYESINFDEVTINVIFPKYRKGLVTTFRLPKFNEFLREKLHK